MDVLVANTDMLTVQEMTICKVACVHFCYSITDFFNIMERRVGWGIPVLLYLIKTFG